MSSMTPYIVDVGQITGGGGTTFNLDLIQVSNTDTSTDINANTGNFTIDVPINGTTEILQGSSFATSGTGVVCNFDGLVKVTANVHYFCDSARCAVQVRLKNNSTPFGPVGSSGYIRDATGHNEASLHVTAWLQVSDGDVINVGSRQESTQGAVATMDDVGTSNLIVERYYNV